MQEKRENKETEKYKNNPKTILKTAITIYLSIITLKNRLNP